jgi:hypothetical protein
MSSVPFTSSLSASDVRIFSSVLDRGHELKCSIDEFHEQLKDRVGDAIYARTLATFVSSEGQLVAKVHREMELQSLDNRVRSLAQIYSPPITFCVEARVSLSSSDDDDVDDDDDTVSCASLLFSGPRLRCSRRQMLKTHFAVSCRLSRVNG